MNDTPTPRTDAAWSCFSGYTEPLQDVKDLSHELERELTAVTEQRDRLAEALRNVMKSGDSTTMYRTAKKALQSLMEH